uniref:Uncharacterized protein n=1 Tax=Myoviridae sp. ctQYc56 TaxID=2825100 RepID=A0A8S5Q0I7_9CAUD|nr:MAG TPA: hypothetical protein [Myoviridae sp. ctQYc56]
MMNKFANSFLCIYAILVKECGLKHDIIELFQFEKGVEI